MIRSISVTDSALPPMIDTHCHLDDRQFADDLERVLQTSRAANVNQWVLIGYDPDRWSDAISMASRHDGMVHTIGVHPACAYQWTSETVDNLHHAAVESGAVGIGEAGLDFYRDNAPFHIQAEAFRGQIHVAYDLALPLVIHMRDAEQEVIDILSSAPELPTLIFHSFDGSAALIDFIRETQSYVGIGGLATRQKSEGLRQLLRSVPSERILLETDSPYLVPARQKDRRNQPAHIATIAMMMAEYLDTTPQNLAKISTENASRVFGLKNE